MINELLIEIPACKICYASVIKAFEEQYKEEVSTLNITISFRSQPERQLHMAGCPKRANNTNVVPVERGNKN